MNRKIDEIIKRLMTGVSNMIPYVIIDEIFTAFYILTSTVDLKMEDKFLSSFSENISELGKPHFR